jgi:Tfp pilus assembly protein PilF
MIQRILLVCTGVVLFALATSATVQDAPTTMSADKAFEAARLNNLGVAYMNQQLFEKALKAFEQAAELDPKLRIAQVNQGIALLNLGRVDAAKPFLEQAVKQDPSDPHAWYNVGLLEKNSADSPAAVDAFRRVTAIDGNDADTWYFLGASLAQNKQSPEAMEAFQHALKLNPQHASAEFGLARAYQQSTDLTRAREHLTRFQHIVQSKLGSPITLAYGEQGKYSIAEDSPLVPQKIPPAIKVRFVDVTQQAGLVTKASNTKPNDLASYLSPGACFLDYDDDGWIDIFLADGGPQGGMALYHNLGNGKFEDVTKKAGIDPTLHGIGCTTGDYDNDGFVDIAVTLDKRVMLLHNEKDGTFKDATESAGIKSPVISHPNFPGFNVGLTFIDYDHDGALDLYVNNYRDGLGFDPRRETTGGSGGIAASMIGPYNTMWRNNSNGSFSDVAAETGLGGSSLTSVGTDYNNDRAVDLVLSNRTVFENPREGKFVPREVWQPETPAAVGVASLDFNHDGWMDLDFTHWNTSGLTLWRNNQGKSFEQVPVPTANWVRGWGVAAIDYDNDGWIDLVAVGETANGKGEVRLLRNLGPDGFKDVTTEVGLDKIVLKAPRAIITGDYDGDGASDLLITQNQGPPVLLRNDGGNQNHWLRLNLTGLSDNKSAIGTKVEVFSGGNRQKFEIAGSSGYLGQNSPYLNVGLGQEKQADIVRMIWPAGVFQDEVEVAADREQKFMEIDRRGSSCPTLFAWDGEHYRFVADMLGASVLWPGPGKRTAPRPLEYVRLARDSIREKDGRLSFRFMEPLEEAVYLDQVNLLAVDHPADLEVYPNEYFATNPPYPSFKVVVSRDARPPAGAWDEHGHNVLPDLLAHRYFGDFEVLPFAGFSQLHTLELDLGEPYQGGPLWLLLHGEVEYFSATGIHAAEQAGIRGIPPFVEALDAQGRWVRVIDDMGFPAGSPRTMTADLTGRLPKGTKRIRFSTKMQLYWNSILIDRADQNQNVRMATITLSRAEVGFHGFPLKIEGNPPGNLMYDYESASATGPYARPAGDYTRHGDVLPLLKSLDDQFVVFGSGDEVALDFDPSRLPVLPQGWARDYFFLANGYEKDMDFYAYDFTRVEPLPFGDMGVYPYLGRSFPLDDAHLNYTLEYNTRHMSGNEAPGYRFDYP